MRAVLQNRDAVILIAAYAAAIWGAVGLRQWVVVFLGFCAGDPMRADWRMQAVAAVINLLGVPAGLWGMSLRSALACALRRSWFSWQRRLSPASLVSPHYCLFF